MSISQGNGVWPGRSSHARRRSSSSAATWRDAADGATFDVISPTSEQRLATLAAAGAADVDAAVEAARAQIDGGEWSRMTGADRGRLLYRLADAMERDLEIFVTLEAHDVGKPAFEPRMVDIPNAIDVIRHFAGWADKIEGRWVTPLPAFGRHAPGVHDPRADRRDRRDRGLERADADRLLEARPGARRRQRRRAQAGRGRAADRAAPGRR